MPSVIFELRLVMLYSAFTTHPNNGLQNIGMEMDAIAPAVIGGTLLTGR
jgi:ribose/xylose/arabinose/galactoside ABC-type transport system permease subunit